MITLNVTKWNISELRLFRTIVDKQRQAVQKNCKGKVSCTGCKYINLCTYYRDAFIIVNKELKKRYPSAY